MKGLVSFVVVTAILLSVVGTATAAPSAKDPRVPALSARVDVLTAQITTLQGQLTREVAFSTCLWAKQVNYNIAVLNIFNAMFGRSAITDHASDNGACAAVGLPPALTLTRNSALSSASLYGAALVGAYALR